MRRVLVTAYTEEPFWRLPQPEREALENGFPEVEWVFREDGLPEREPSLARVDAWFGWTFPDAALAGAGALRWMHSASTGVRRFLTPAFRERRIVLTSARGAHAPFLAEQAMAWMLGHVRRQRETQAAAAEARWAGADLLAQNPPGTLLGKQLVILGYGAAGRELARRAEAFGMRVTGVRRTPAGDEDVPCVAPDALDGLLPRADFLANLLPYTDATRGLVSADVLDRLPRGAFVLNLGRGRTLDQDALAERLADGRLGGAGLDVFGTEPLPSESPLWKLPTVSITPHVGGVSTALWGRICAGFADNLRRFLDGRPLENVVDPDRGY